MLLSQLDMLTLDMFASQTRDLDHIETAGYIEFTEGKYIEPSNARYIDKKDCSTSSLFN